MGILPFQSTLRQAGDPAAADCAPGILAQSSPGRKRQIPCRTSRLTWGTGRGRGKEEILCRQEDSCPVRERRHRDRETGRARLCPSLPPGLYRNPDVLPVPGQKQRVLPSYAGKGGDLPCRRHPVIWMEDSRQGPFSLPLAAASRIPGI